MTADQYRTLLLATVQNIRDQTVSEWIGRDDELTERDRGWAEAAFTAIESFELVLQAGA